MVPRFACAATLFCIIAGCAAVPAHQSQMAPSPPMDTIDCRMLARMPNAPMTLETCEQRMGVQFELMNALETPGGERRGDEAMTCDAIAAEIRTLNVSGVSAENAAAGEAAGQNVIAIMNRAMGEAAGMMTTQTARSAAAATVPGNVAGNTAAAANMTEQRALQERTAAQLGPARDRLEAANTNSMRDLANAMRGNPRFARLVKLGMARNCQG